MCQTIVFTMRLIYSGFIEGSETGDVLIWSLHRSSIFNFKCLIFKVNFFIALWGTSYSTSLNKSHNYFSVQFK